MGDRLKQVIAVIADVSRKPVEAVVPEAELVGDLGIDSPRALELLIRIEDDLGIEISDEDAEGLNTVADVMRFVEAG